MYLLICEVFLYIGSNRVGLRQIEPWSSGSLAGPEKVPLVKHLSYDTKVHYNSSSKWFLDSGDSKHDRKKSSLLLLLRKETLFFMVTTKVKWLVLTLFISVLILPLSFFKRFMTQFTWY